MEKWTKEEVAEVIENLPLQRKIIVMSVLQHIPSILTVGVSWKSHTNLTHPGKYFRPSKVKIMRPTSPK